MKHYLQNREYARAVQSVRRWTREYLLAYECEVRERAYARGDHRGEAGARARDLSSLTEQLRGLRAKLNRVRRNLRLPPFEGMHPREVPSPL